MGRDWIEEGLRETTAREQQRPLASEHRQRQAATIAAKAPELMRGLLAEVGAALDEYRQKAPERADDMVFDLLPHEGFSITKASFPQTYLECRPNYAGHVLCCNFSRTDLEESRVYESAFNLLFTVNDSDEVVLLRERKFQNPSAVAEFLLKPALFPQSEYPL
jgi:hypothetical protein